ncbi:alpha-tocopherol transfer protein-like [Euwallacea fornicatus]|uniref:alpha-tocopherol transfer protein-like n=1 Tax=Euwallacea fornicatus TaxID=995702 RepID=UPI00338E014E
MTKLPYQFTSEDIVKQGRTTQESIDAIRAWLSSVQSESLPEIQDELIVIFLLSCEHDIPLTKNTIIMYYKCKKNGPEIFDNWNMERLDLKRAMNTVGLSSIPVRTDEDYVVHYFKLQDTNYSNFDLIPAMTVSYMLLDISQERDPPKGLIVIIDTKGVGLMHLVKLKMSALKKYLEFLQEGLPIQIKTIHIINTVSFFGKIMNLIKIFMKSELITMIQTHPPNASQERLFSIVPKKCWPADYGGDLPSVEELHKRTIQQFNEKQDFWALEEEIRKKCS